VKFNYKILLAFCLLTGMLHHVHAQEELTLGDAIQLGLANNFDIQIEELNVEIAQNNNNWAEAGRWPTINFSISQDNNFRDVDNPASFLQGLTISNDIGPAVTLNWVLFDGFRVQINRERLQKLQDLSMGNAQLIIENAVQSIITQYYLTQLEKERTDVLRDVFLLSKDRYEYIKLKSELGSAVTFDVLQEQTAFLTDSSNFVSQQVNYRNARRTLNLLMGQEIDLEYELVNELDVQLNDYDLDDLYNKMTSSNINLQNQYLNLELARADTRLAKTELYPRLTFSASGAYTWSRQDLSNAELLRPIDNPITRPKTANYAAGITLNYLLFDGGRVRRSIENAYTTERIRQMQIDQLKLSLRNDLIATHDLYQARKQLLNIAEENIRIARLNLELADDRFETGTINSFDYRQIQVNYLNTALNKLQAEFNLLDSETELLRLTGGILNEYENLE
jgi:outer membrane protein TolC